MTRVSRAVDAIEQATLDNDGPPGTIFNVLIFLFYQSAATR